jgi:peptide/nickel transport system permease protein
MLRMLLRRFFSDLRNLFPLAMVGVFFVVATMAPLLSPPNDDTQMSFNRVERMSPRPLPPSSDYPLGTFPGGYDVLHSLIWGTRSALIFGISVTLLTSAIGILVGALSNLAGGIFAKLGMRVTDAFLTFPTLAGILLFIQILQPVTAGSISLPLNSFQRLVADLHLEPVMIALILFSWMPYSRLTFSSIQQQKSLAYIDAAKVCGLTDWQIFFRHILPNIVTPLIVLITRDIGGFVIFEAALVFIGLSHFTEWGIMISASRNWIVTPNFGFDYWWTFLPVTLTLILFSISWQWLGQRINSTLNPRSFSFLK